MKLGAEPATAARNHERIHQRLLGLTRKELIVTLAAKATDIMS
jgi:hypothetical protein